MQDLGQCKDRRDHPGQRLPCGGEGLQVREREFLLEAHVFLIQQAPTRHTLSYFCHFSTSRGRIHDGIPGGVIFYEGGKGRVEGCKIWGNAVAGVYIQGDGSEAVVAGSECVRGSIF